MNPYFTVPADFVPDTLRTYSGRDWNIPVREVYGSLKIARFGGGRHDSVLPDCPREDFAAYVRAAAERGIEFNYLLNAACMSGEELTADGQRRLGSWLEFLFECGVRRITAALPPLVDFILRRHPGFRVYVSVIAGIDSVSRLRRFLGDRRVAGIYLHETLHRDLPALADVCRECRARGIEVGMIVNTLCDADCPWRHFHYDLVSHAIPGERFPYLWYYGTECKLRRLRDPKQVLRLPWVRPDDIPRYLEAGVERFKLGGRDLIKFGADFARTVADYNTPPFRGNLSDLFFCYAQVERRGLYHLDNNPRLSAFLDANFSGELHCRDCDDCGKCADLAASIAPDPEARDQFAALCAKRREGALFLDQR